MKGVRMHDAMARRRDADEMKLEKMKIIDKYFDKWSKITTRYENWTAPEYYKAADKNFRKTGEEQNKLIALEQRREKLRNLLDSEKNQYDKELDDLLKPKPRKIPTEMLKGINELYKRTEEEKRRLELESGLYKRWRHSAREEQILTSSRSDHEALAKMNWLDKQIANQIEREKLENERESARVRLVEEIRRDEERMSARKAERDEELSDLKNFQEKQLTELKSRESETEQLHREEIELRECEEKLQNEQIKLKNHANERGERIPISTNIRRIKMQLRNLSEAVLRDIQFHTMILERLSSLQHIDNHQTHRLREKINAQYELEIQKQRQIESMYESEAKTFLIKQQETWLNESQDREQRIRDLIDHQIYQIHTEIDFIVARKNELNELRESLRRAIDAANDRINNLLGANSSDDKLRIKSAEKLRQTITPLTNDDGLDSNRDVDAHVELSLPELFSKTVNVTEKNESRPPSSNRPQFGRKKIAWT